MEFYRGTEFERLETELKAIIDKKENDASLTKHQNCFSGITIFKSPEFLRPFKCVAGMEILLSLSGLWIMVKYSASYFEGW